MARKRALFFLMLHLMLGLHLSCLRADPIRLDAPAGGWVHGGLTDRSGDAGVAYPTPPIDRGMQTDRTLIRGHLQAAGKQRKLPVMVVNGNPMPLYSGADGAFARPYAFGVGSNSIEVRDYDSGQSKRVQFLEVNPTRTQAKIRVILAWDDKQAELDLHVITPDGQHAFFANPVLKGGGGMDVDSVDGAGPEMFSVTAPVRGIYKVYLNYWGNFGPGGYHFDEKTREIPVITARVTLVFNENTTREKRETFVVPVRKIGDLALVRSFVF